MNAERQELPPPQGKPEAPGVQLKAQRQAMGWSVEQVADQLKLAPRQVVALEEGDDAALPNLAVVRGFIRAYAKVVKLDAAPLVAMIDVAPLGGQDAAPARREISATFSETRFPSMTQRSSRPTLLIGGGVVAALVAAALGAYQLGYVSPAMLNHGDAKVVAPVASATVVAPAATPQAQVETTLLKPGQEVPLLQSTTVPLVSVAPPGGSTPAEPPVAPAATAPAPAPAAATAAAPAAANALVLNLRQDSWVEIRRTGAAPLVSRLMRAGSSESFDITEPVLLIVGKPAGVDATLRGAHLELTPVPGGTTSRLNIK